MPDELEKTSRQSTAHLKPLLAALQRAKAAEAEAALAENEITQKMAPEVIIALREHVSGQTAVPSSPQAYAEAPATNAEAFTTAMLTLPKAMHDQVTAALAKAKAGLGKAVPEEFATNAIHGEVARAISSGYLSGMLAEMLRPAFAQKIVSAYTRSQRF